MSKKSQQDAPGNAIGSAQAMQQVMSRIGVALTRFEVVRENADERGVYLLGLSARLPNLPGEEVLIVLRGQTDVGAVVAFHSASTFAEAISGAITRLDNGSLKWKEDTYAGR